MFINDRPLLAKILQWELYFDQEQIQNQKVETDNIPLMEIILSANAGNHLAVLQHCENLFNTSKNDFILQIFSIHWAVAATEAIYDMNLRSQWVARWSQVHSWKHNFWAQFLFNSQKAIGYFYEGALHESNAYFQICLEIAKAENYSRGIYRTLFNLGMIEKDRLNFEKSKEYLEQALIVVENTKSIRMIKKIKLSLENLNNKISYHHEMGRVLGLLSEGKHRDARSFIKKLFKLRKWDNINPEKNSDYMLMAVYYYHTKKMKSFNIIINRIVDPIIKFQSYKICSQIYALPFQNQFEFDLLKRYFDAGSGRSNKNSLSKNEIIKYSSDSNKLLNLLKNHPSGLSKEEITRILWQQHYDPFYHDSKIYKLVLKCRKEAKNPNVLVNNYGLYRIGS